jgi:hypothetical protein
MNFTAIAAEVTEAHIIGEDEHDVWWGGRGGVLSGGQDA